MNAAKKVNLIILLIGLLVGLIFGVVLAVVLTSPIVKEISTIRVLNETIVTPLNSSNITSQTEATTEKDVSSLLLQIINNLPTILTILVPLFIIWLFRKEIKKLLDRRVTGLEVPGLKIGLADYPEVVEIGARTGLIWSGRLTEMIPTPLLLGTTNISKEEVKKLVARIDESLEEFGDVVIEIIGASTKQEKSWKGYAKTLYKLGKERLHLADIYNMINQKEDAIKEIDNAKLNLENGKKVLLKVNTRLVELEKSLEKSIDFKPLYLFSWGNVPGKDNGRLVEYLEQKYGVDWVETAKIEKIDGGKAIRVITENSTLSLRLNDDKTEATLIIDDGTTDKLIAKMENGKLSIYKPFIDNEYLFSWDDIPGNDDERLFGFLKKRFDIEWVENAKIDKIDDGRMIRLSFKNNFLSLKLNDDKTKVSLKIDDGRTDELIANSEKSKLNIYDNNLEDFLQFLDTVNLLGICKHLEAYISNVPSPALLKDAIKHYGEVISYIFYIFGKNKSEQLSPKKLVEIEQEKIINKYYKIELLKRLATYYHNKGDAYLGLSDYKRSEEELDITEKILKNMCKYDKYKKTRIYILCKSYNLHKSKGDLFFQQNFVDKADQEFDEAIVKLEELKKFQTEERKESNCDLYDLSVYWWKIKNKYDYAKRLYANGLIKEAEKVFEDAIKLFENNRDKINEVFREGSNFSFIGIAQIYYELGLLYINTDELETAKEKFKEAIKILPEDPELHVALGNVKSSIGEFDEAIQEYDHALRENPNHPIALLNREATVQKQPRKIQEKREG